ncbi:hypothetical protein DH2020_025962 [Rehmannia glutinosa]|uniref:Kinesin-like protein n=1 Tax=Rehmannia glutinosa TaxID=99300 RepID=A0ABR0W0Y9_REHGL
MVSMTPESRKVGTGMAPSPSPFYTPRPERRRPDSRGSDWNSNRQDKDKEVNVQVERAKVITCNESKREVTVLQNVASKQVDKVFTFDKVFGPKAQQRSIYDQSISPIVSEVLEGFNCTVFAYGQTGTGKTYTMEGGMRNKGGELPAEAGIIPRAVRQIFDTLEAQNADYKDRPKKPISLMEDGKGSVIISGLEEEAVYSANEIYSLLERGAARRRTADTLLNKRSSRSHSIFTITVHIKDGNIGDEELIKCGKLNLVDLAGSENIYRSGAREGDSLDSLGKNKDLHHCYNLSANQKVSKALLLKDLYVEIERMKQDIRAAREKNGVYIPHERFLQDEAEKKAKSERIEQLESDLNVSEKQLDKFRELYLTEQEEKLNVESELKDCKKTLETTCKSLEDLQENYNRALLVLKEKESLISKLQYSESSLIDCAKKMRLNLQDASEDISALFGKIASSDLEEMTSINQSKQLQLRISSNASLEAKEVISDIQNSLNEQQKTEEASREEKIAREKIAEILSTLTARKTEMVSKASKRFEDAAAQESKRMLLELSDMQQILTSETKELNEYAEKVKNHFVDETFSSTERRVIIENCLQECAEKVDRTKILETQSIHDNIVSTSSCVGAEFDSHINDLLTSINDSLVLDKENTKEINLITTTGLDQLKSITVNHSEHVSDIRNRSEQCIHKDYLVAEKNATPKKRAIRFPVWSP